MGSGRYREQLKHFLYEDLDSPCSCTCIVDYTTFLLDEVLFCVIWSFDIYHWKFKVSTKLCFAFYHCHESENILRGGLISLELARA